MRCISKNIASIVSTKIFFVFIFSIFLFSVNISAQNNIEEYEYKKIMIFKITRFIEWVDTSKVNTTKSPLVISVIGENPFNGKLKKFASDKNHTIKKKQVIVKNIQTIEEIDGCDILFISHSERYDISKIIKYTRKKSILTIGDYKGYVEKGVMIGLIQKGEYIKFYINKKEADQSGFYINSQLLGNAIKVIK